MKGYAIGFILGGGLILFHYALPVIPFGFDLIAGVILLIITGTVLVQWIITENRARPAVEPLALDMEELHETTQEILFLIDQGWGIKRIVDMISANYKLPPKMVYEHVVELMNTDRKIGEGGLQPVPIDPLHNGKKIDTSVSEMEVYYDENEDE